MAGSESLDESGFQTNAAGGYDSRLINGGGFNNNTGQDRQQATQSKPSSTYIYGDELEMNCNVYDDSVLCLSFNLNGLKREQWKEKNERLRKFLKNYNFDIMGF